MKPESSQQEELDRLLRDLGEDDMEHSPEELDNFVEALALGFGTDEAPSGTLREKVLSQAAPTGEELPTIPPVTELPPRRSSRFSTVIIPWAAAAVFAILAALGWMKYGSAKSGMAESERQLTAAAKGIAALQLENEDLSEAVENFKNSSELDQLKIAALESELDRSYFGVAVWDAEKERGILRVARIPDLEGEAKDYQLWVVDPQYDTPVDGGVFQVDADGAATISFKPDRKISAATAFAVSLEKKGGVPVAEGPMVLVGAL